jgi:hypothetical protein
MMQFEGRDMPARVRELWEALQTALHDAGVCCDYHHTLTLAAELELTQNPPPGPDEVLRLGMLAADVYTYLRQQAKGPIEASAVLGLVLHQLAEHDLRHHAAKEKTAREDGRTVLPVYCGRDE